MALSMAACRGQLWRLGPGLSCCQRDLSSQCRSLSTKAGSRSVLAALVSMAKRLTGRYERFLELTFPRFYVLHSTFTRGIHALFLEVKEIRDIRSRMAQQGLSVKQLPYRDMERLRQFRRDLIKTIPIGIISIPPFANFLVIVLMYFFPRQLLIRHFWTPQQQLEFQDTYDSIRRDSYPVVLESLVQAAHSLPDPRLQRRLQQLCSQVQCGSHPSVAELWAVRAAFASPVLALNRLQVSHVQALSRVLFLTPHLPGPILRRRLRSHVLEIRELDLALQRLSLGQLHEEELRAPPKPLSWPTVWSCSPSTTSDPRSEAQPNPSLVLPKAQPGG
ncbi:LETM1 domain-containing protein 1 isoform X2 [Melopsittacus undulatus]|uniref:LETM1 domain-containing protein 1 isoform X2 n=1 Tax=Melopsittacus undulatus TaxID=13146 RepID=UPI00146A23B7|nr:LETM1 domain-containing protein 1 isoform X2 [Melopsittacus undulatus]XP_033927374.1 LETM1 domain-containing protein 1 isoform X2 [Melopsittacus undulatus]XP_033927375.1 LETM1 domain-containing protein 1 isoform X2 [Melopsittacus undulatus]